MKISGLRNVSVSGINMDDYPDLVDAYICYAEDSNGKPLTDEQLETLTITTKSLCRRWHMTKLWGGQYD